MEDFDKRNSLSKHFFPLKKIIFLGVAIFIKSRVYGIVSVNKDSLIPSAVFVLKKDAFVTIILLSSSITVESVV